MIDLHGLFTCNGKVEWLTTPLFVDNEFSSIILFTTWDIFVHFPSIRHADLTVLVMCSVLPSILGIIQINVRMSLYGLRMCFTTTPPFIASDIASKFPSTIFTPITQERMVFWDHNDNILYVWSGISFSGRTSHLGLVQCHYFRWCDNPSIFDKDSNIFTCIASISEIKNISISS